MLWRGLEKFSTEEELPEEVSGRDSTGRAFAVDAEAVDGLG
jgi:hypothetical protein